MTTYADDNNLRNPAVLNGNGIAAAVDGLLISYAQKQSSTLFNTTSNSPVDIDASTAISVTVQSRQAVDLIGIISFSASAANLGMQLVLYRGSVAVNFGTAANAYRSDVNGGDLCVVVVATDKPGTGTFSYNLRWSVGSGTGYSHFQQLRALVFQNG